MCLDIMYIKCVVKIMYMNDLQSEIEGVQMQISFKIKLMRRYSFRDYVVASELMQLGMFSSRL